MPSLPDITVLVPAYNAAKYIARAIDSVLAQSFANFELLVINDGSTDDTQLVIESFNDPRIRLINQTNQGVAAALNIGLLNARAELVARFDADDICMPHRLQLQYDFMRSHPAHVLVGSNAHYINKNGEYVFTETLPAYDHDAIRELEPMKCPFIHSAVMFRKSCILEAGGYDTLAFAFEDHLLWSKIIQYHKTANLPQVLLQVRLNPGSVSIDERWRTKRFHEIKSGAIRQGFISEDESAELLLILKKQDTWKIKHASYYSLLGKKYTWDNHQPRKARHCLRRAISIHPGRLDSYAIMALSFFPKEFINWMYRRKWQKVKA